MRHALIAALLAAFVLPAHSQTEDSIVVSASRTEQRMRDAIPHITVLTARDIRDSQAFDLPSLLRREAGFEFSQNGGIGTVTGIFLRGGRSAQALVLIDGMRVEDAGFGAAAFQHILLDEVDRVEIVRGNVSSLYGSNAIGGVIQVFTKRGHGTPAPSFEATLGSRGTSKLSAGIGGEAGDTRFNLTVSQLDTNGFSAINTNQAPNANPDRDGYGNTSLSGSLSHRFSPRHEAGATLFSTRGRVDYDSAFGVRTDVHKSAQDLENASLYWEARWLDWWKSRFTLGQGSDYRRDTLNGNFANTSNTRSRQFIWDNEVRLSPEHLLTLGAENLRQSLANSSFAQLLRRDAGSLRAGYLGHVGRHSLQLNTRREDYSDFGKASTYFAGYGFDLTEQWRLIASGSNAFRAPTFQDLFGFGGNPNLRPERSHTNELGVQWADGPHRLRVVAFDTKYQDAITFDLATFTVRNVRKASVQGFETSYTGRIGEFDLRASLTVQDPIEQEPNAMALQAIRRAKAFGSFSAFRSFGALRLGGEVLSGGARPDSNITTGARLQEAGYTLVNLTARYQFDKNLYVAAKLENAFNEKYQLVNGFNTPPQGVFFTVGWQP